MGAVKSLQTLFDEYQKAQDKDAFFRSIDFTAIIDDANRLENKSRALFTIDAFINFYQAAPLTIKSLLLQKLTPNLRIACLDSGVLHITCHLETSHRTFFYKQLNLELYVTTLADVYHLIELDEQSIIDSFVLQPAALSNLVTNYPKLYHLLNGLSNDSRFKIIDILEEKLFTLLQTTQQVSEVFDGLLSAGLDSARLSLLKFQLHYHITQQAQVRSSFLNLGLFAWLKLDRQETLEELVSQATTSPGPERSICIRCGWMNHAGVLAADAPKCIKTVAVESCPMP